MREICAICNKYPAQLILPHDGISVPLCRRCFQLDQIDRKYRETLRAVTSCLRKKEYVLARKKLQSALRRLSKDKPLYIKQWLEREHMDWMSYLCYMTGDYQCAIELMNKRLARKYTSNYSELTSNLLLADAYHRYGDKIRAKRALERALIIGISRKEPSALSALERLKDYYGESLMPKPLYLQAIRELCPIKKIKVPTGCKNIKNGKALAACIDWVSSVKRRWY